MKKTVRFFGLFLLGIMLLSTVVSASSSYATYTYSSDGFVLESPDAYVIDSVIDSEYIGIDSLNSPTDIETDEDGNVFIADAAANRILVLDAYYKLNESVGDTGVISSFVNENGVNDSFNNPQGVFVNRKYIYVCDTDNSRIVIFDRKGDFVKTVAQPISNLFEEDALYKPVAVAVDSYGRMFIVSSTTYQGIIVMSDTGDFYGFIGAQKVTGGSGLSAMMEKLGFSDKDEDENISSEYNNITVDSDNFVYVTTSTIDEDVQQANISSRDGTYAPVKKFNASDKDVLRRNGFFAPSGEVAVAKNPDAEIKGASTIVDAAVGPEGMWSIADQKRSKIFTYDNDGNLLFAFGDMGNLKGNITNLVAITYQKVVKEDGETYKLIALDKSSSTFTVYRRTEYCDILVNALHNQNARVYASAVEDWKEILKRNNNFDVAYIGIGKALARDGKYSEAMQYFKDAHDKGSGYTDAFKQIRKDWASRYFVVIPVVAVGVIVLIALGLGKAGKINREATLKVGTKSIGEEICYGFHIMLHPFDGFWDLKHEKRGSTKSALIILLVTVVAFFYQSIGTSYTIDMKSADDYGSIYSTILSLCVPVLLWVIANWCLTTLFDGEGKFSDIFTATCYALFPLPLFIIPSVLLSNVLVSEEAGIISLLVTIGWVWAGVLLVLGMMSIHGYSFIKNIGICLCTVVGMAIIIFLAILFGELMVKIFGLISRIWTEISFRL